MDLRRRVGPRAMRLLVAVIGVASSDQAPGNGRAGRHGGPASRSGRWTTVSPPERHGLGRQPRPGRTGHLRRRHGSVLATRPVGAGAHDICISEQAGKAYITAETIGIVTTVDLETLAMESIPVGPLPHHLEPSHDGRTIYVRLASHSAAVGAPQYAAIDTDDQPVSYGHERQRGARSHGPHPSLDGETLYVAHDIGDRVSAIDLLTGAISFEIPSIPRAEEAIATRFGDQLWVSAGRRHRQARRPRHRPRHQLVRVGVQPESVMLTPPNGPCRQPPGSPATLAFVDTRPSRSTAASGRPADSSATSP